MDVVKHNKNNLYISRDYFYYALIKLYLYIFIFIQVKNIINILKLFSAIFYHLHYYELYC